MSPRCHRDSRQHVQTGAPGRGPTRHGKWLRPALAPTSADQRARSGVAYKQQVGGSTPSAPTTRRRDDETTTTNDDAHGRPKRKGAVTPTTMPTATVKDVVLQIAT